MGLSPAEDNLPAIETMPAEGAIRVDRTFTIRIGYLVYHDPKIIAAFGAGLSDVLWHDGARYMFINRKESSGDGSIARCLPSIHRRE